MNQPTQPSTVSSAGDLLTVLLNRPGPALETRRVSLRSLEKAIRFPSGENRPDVPGAIDRQALDVSDRCHLRSEYLKIRKYGPAVGYGDAHQPPSRPNARLLQQKTKLKRRELLSFMALTCAAWDGTSWMEAIIAPGRLLVLCLLGRVGPWALVWYWDP